MQACTRRSFMTQVVLGTAALATVGRALASPAAASRREDCASCQFYTPTPGATTGTCAFAGKTVSAEDGCGEFMRHTPASTAAVNATRP